MLSFLCNYFENSYFTLAFLSGTIILTLLWTTKQRKNLPPGPRRIPVLGHLPWIKSCPHVKLTNMIAQYGNIFHLYLGNRLAIILGDHESIKEALVKDGDNFAVRPMLYLYELTSQGYGLVMAEGRLWQEQRRFVLSTLKDFGFGKTSMEDKIKEEIDHFLQYMLTYNAEPFNPRDGLAKSISNNICSIVFGKRFDYEDPKFYMFLDMMTENLHLLGSAGAVNFFPFLRFLPGGFGSDKVRKNIDTFHKFYDECITEHLESLQEDDPRDFIDAYLIQMNKEEESKNEDTTFTRRQLIQILQNIFDAGTDTTATTIQWAFLYLSVYPEIQSKLQKEIDAVIGSSRTPTYEDRSSMPYTDAVIMEVLRLSCVLPMPVHTNKEAAVISGYEIPKNSIIFPLLWAVHRNPEHWKDPDVFLPERFLDENGKIIKPQTYMPFSIGRRNCMGETLAKLEIFLYLTYTFQHFTIEVADKNNPPSLDCQSGLVSSPFPFSIRAVPRD